MSEPWLIVGADGLLGGALRDRWRRDGHRVFATALLPVADREGVVTLDLAQPVETWPALPACKVAVLCAAITNLEYCRRNSTETRWVNVVQSVRLAERLTADGCFVVFISSNLVFDGSKSHSLPHDPTCPMTEYGRQKAEAEASLARLGERVAVVRLTKVMHPAVPLFRNWRETLSLGKPITPFSDFLCSPITLDSVLAALTAVAEQHAAGIWQLSASADLSYAVIAARLAQRWQAKPSLVQPVSWRDRSTLEHVPEHTTLDATETHRRIGFEIPEPLAAVDQAFAS